MTTYYDVGDGKTYTGAGGIQSAIDAIPDNLSGTGHHMVRVYSIAATSNIYNGFDAYTGFSNSTDGVDYVEIVSMVNHDNRTQSEGGSGILINTLGSTSSICYMHWHFLIHGFEIGSYTDVAAKSYYGVQTAGAISAPTYIYDNIIHDISFTGGGTSARNVAGIYSTHSALCYNNRIFNMSTNANHVSAYACGIAYNRAGNLIYHNNIYSMTASGALSNGEFGVYNIIGGDTHTVRGNIIYSCADGCYKWDGAETSANTSYNISDDATASAQGGIGCHINQNMATDVYLNAYGDVTDIRSTALYLAPESSALGITTDIYGNARSADENYQGGIGYFITTYTETNLRATGNFSDSSVDDGNAWVEVSSNEANLDEWEDVFNLVQDATHWTQAGPNALAQAADAAISKVSGKMRAYSGTTNVQGIAYKSVLTFNDGVFQVSVSGFTGRRLMMSLYINSSNLAQILRYYDGSTHSFIGQTVVGGVSTSNQQVDATAPTTFNLRITRSGNNFLFEAQTTGSWFTVYNATSKAIGSNAYLELGVFNVAATSQGDFDNLTISGSGRYPLSSPTCRVITSGQTYTLDAGTGSTLTHYGLAADVDNDVKLRAAGTDTIDWASPDSGWSVYKTVSEMYTYLSGGSIDGYRYLLLQPQFNSDGSTSATLRAVKLLTEAVVSSSPYNGDHALFRGINRGVLVGVY